MSVGKLRELIVRHKSGEAVGIYSVCSAHPMVVEAAVRCARRDGNLVLIEATSNQVNQDGGYTGLTPVDFATRIHQLAARVGVAADQVLLGGDHLGPNCWQHLTANAAMAKADRLIEEYVRAGFRKIHLDCSMSCADDPQRLDEAQIAERAARLCAVAEATSREVGGEAPVYIVGTEVPTPGGAHHSLQDVTPTAAGAAFATIAAHEEMFRSAGLQGAWQRVLGIVVQPGVEFDHHQVVDFRPAAAAELGAAIERVPGLIYEAHSTDYQTPASLRALTMLHFAILKVGPALTFALREALWALESIERECCAEHEASRLREVVLAAMASNPGWWRKYYATQGAALILDQQYSLSDRIRYYWAVPSVQSAVERLFANLDARPLPMTLLSQYLPAQFAAVRAGLLAPTPRDLVLHYIGGVLDQYAAACGATAS